MRKPRSIYEVGKSTRKELFSVEGHVSQDLVHAYGIAYEQLKFQLDMLIERIKQHKADKKPISRSWLSEQGRYQQLLAQAEEKMQLFGRQASEYIERGQGRMVQLGGDHAERMVTNGITRSPFVGTGYTFNRIPHESLEHLVGFLGDGSPLRAIFDSYGQQASQMARDVITTAVITGKNPRQTKYALADALGGNLDRSLLIARTEQLRVYRSASQENYAANDDIITGQTRIETLDDLTCVPCICEHGQVYPVDWVFEGHPNCRGTVIPNVVGSPPKTGTGEAWFAKQDPERQKEILGPAKYDAFKKGEIELSDLNEHTQSEKWGGGRKERSLDDARELAASRD